MTLAIRRATLAPALTLLALLIGFAAFRAAPAAAGNRMAANDLINLNNALQDPARAADAVKTVRSFLASNPDSVYALYMRRMLLAGLITSKAPGLEVAGAADTAIKTFTGEENRQQRAILSGEVAQYLVNRKELPDRALKLARASYREVPPDPNSDALRGYALATLGEAFLFNNRADTAVVVLKRALEFSPDSARVLSKLGGAYEKGGKTDLAINSYVRSLGVYLNTDTTSMAPLRALWIKKNGSVAGLDAAVNSARASSRKNVALDSRRYERPAPAWTLPDLQGKDFRLADYKGKVVVLDFWGSWCGPCRQELPVFQQMYERYRQKDVVFFGVNWEKGGNGQDLKQLVRDFMGKNNYNFPVVLDHERSAQMAYDIQGFPTVYLIDRTGMIRYQNVGVADGIEHILADQIESLLE
jgi:thiol-disulfide isomerase/thioredoxin/Flp pilus assembly protein TadD